MSPSTHLPPVRCRADPPGIAGTARGIPGRLPVAGCKAAPAARPHAYAGSDGLVQPEPGRPLGRTEVDILVPLRRTGVHRQDLGTDRSPEVARRDSVDDAHAVTGTD